MLGKIEGRRRRGQERIRWLDGITDSTDMNLGANSGRRPGTVEPGSCSPWGHEESDTTWWLSNSSSTASTGQSESESQPGSKGGENRCQISRRRYRSDSIAHADRERWRLGFFFFFFSIFQKYSPPQIKLSNFYVIT